MKTIIALVGVGGAWPRPLAELLAPQRGLRIIGVIGGGSKWLTCFAQISMLLPSRWPARTGSIVAQVECDAIRRELKAERARTPGSTLPTSRPWKSAQRGTVR